MRKVSEQESYQKPRLVDITSGFALHGKGHQLHDHNMQRYKSSCLWITIYVTKFQKLLKERDAYWTVEAELREWWTWGSRGGCGELFFHIPDATTDGHRGKEMPAN